MFVINLIWLEDLQMFGYITVARCFLILCNIHMFVLDGFHVAIIACVISLLNRQLIMSMFNCISLRNHFLG